MCEEYCDFWVKRTQVLRASLCRNLKTIVLYALIMRLSSMHCLQTLPSSKWAALAALVAVL